MRCRHQTAANRKTSPLGAEIHDRRTLGPGWRETPSEFGELVRSGFEPPDHRGFIGRPDVLAWFQVGYGGRPLHRNPGLAEGREVIAVGDVISEVVAHGWNVARTWDLSRHPPLRSASK